MEGKEAINRISNLSIMNASLKKPGEIPCLICGVPLNMLTIENHYSYNHSLENIEKQLVEHGWDMEV